MKVEDQIAIIYCGVKGLLNNVPVNKIKQCEEDLVKLLNREFKQILDDLRSGKLTEDVTNGIESALNQVLKNYS